MARNPCQKQENSQCGKKSRQHQPWHDVERNLVSTKPRTAAQKIVSARPGTMWEENSSAPDLARCEKKNGQRKTWHETGRKLAAPTLARNGKKTRQHQNWHDVERKLLSTKTWHDVERKLLSTKPGTMWKENSSARNLARCGKKSRKNNFCGGADDCGLGQTTGKVGWGRRLNVARLNVVRLRRRGGADVHN